MCIRDSDLTDPAPATTFAHLDATTVLSRSIVELGIYPAVDPLELSLIHICNHEPAAEGGRPSGDTSIENRQEEKK